MIDLGLPSYYDCAVSHLPTQQADGLTPRDHRRNRKTHPMAIPTSPSKQSQYDIGFNTGLSTGRGQGRQAVRKQVLDFLQEKYMDRNISTDSQYSKEILELTMELSKLMKVN